MTTPTVFHYYSELVGAPTLNGTAGSLIAVLDACLINGFGLKTADSMVVSGGKATINISSGHSFEQDIVVLVAGATPAALNGLKRVESRSTNTAVVDAAGIADGAASGTITVKIAPAGWEKAYSGTNLAAYRSNDVTGTRLFLRVDDTSGRNGRVIGYESMSDMNSGVRAFPSSSQLSGGGYWPKSNNGDASARAWTVVADGRGFWIHMHTNASNPGSCGSLWEFGDFESYKSGDTFSCGLTCANSDMTTQSAGSQFTGEYVGLSNTSCPFVARSFSGLGGSVNVDHAAESHFSGNGVSGAVANAQAPTYPNGPNNGLILSRKILVERGVALRGIQRGLFITPQNCNGSFNWRDKVDGQGDLSGRRLMAIKCGSPSGTSSQGVVFFDIIGPWG